MDINEETKTEKANVPNEVNGKKGVAAFFAGAGKSAAKLAEDAKNSVVKALDANDDGKFDLKDLSLVANQFGEKRENEKQKKEFNSLKPIFEETVSAPEFTLPKILRVAEIDKKHAEAESCKNSIGFNAEHDDIQIVTVYPKWTKLLGLKFYPNESSEIYYVDPCDRDQYIALEEYFKYLRLKKVFELQMIAQKLGAKHFRVTYVEQESIDNRAKTIANLKGKATGSQLNGEIDHEMTANKFSKVSTNAEMDCLGHEPEEPELQYLKGNPNIEALIKMRMEKNAPIHQKVSINLISSSGINLKNAAKIDGALSALHFGGNMSIQKEAQNESKTTLEYEIDY